MSEIFITKLTPENFGEGSLDGFVRHQVVNECWRRKDSGMKLVREPFVEDWSPAQKREIAGRMLGNIRRGFIGVGAFDGGTLVGWALLGNEFIGSGRNYLELVMFHVSEPYRNRGTGRRLFTEAVAAAAGAGAEKLFISAHSSKESQAAYKALGCIPAEEFFAEAAEAEPYDIQLEFDLRKG